MNKQVPQPLLWSYYSMIIFAGICIISFGIRGYYTISIGLGMVILSLLELVIIVK